jgi:hypothetical protein
MARTNAAHTPALSGGGSAPSSSFVDKKAQFSRGRLVSAITLGCSLNNRVRVRVGSRGRCRGRVKIRVRYMGKDCL